MRTSQSKSFRPRNSGEVDDSAARSKRLPYLISASSLHTYATRTCLTLRIRFFTIQIADERRISNGREGADKRFNGGEIVIVDDDARVGEWKNPTSRRWHLDRRIHFLNRPDCLRLAPSFARWTSPALIRVFFSRSLPSLSLSLSGRARDRAEGGGREVTAALE